MAMDADARAENQVEADGENHGDAETDAAGGRSGHAESDHHPAAGRRPVAAVLGAVRALARGVDLYRYALAAQLGLGLPELITLAELLVREPLRAGEVGQRTGLTQGSVTALLDRLEGRGYLTRARPQENKRTVAIMLTPAGRQLAADMFAPLEPLLARVADEPGAPDPDRLAHCLTHIAEALTELATQTDRDGVHPAADAGPRGTRTGRVDPAEP